MVRASRGRPGEPDAARRDRGCVADRCDSQHALGGGASTSIGAGFTLTLTTPVTGAPVAWQSIILLLAVILVAMLFIVVVVQIDLRRPLRRLDAAVAALGQGDFDVPVSTSSVDEVGRLGASFEAMRQQVRSTMRATATRASVATQLTRRAAARDGAGERV